MTGHASRPKSQTQTAYLASLKIMLWVSESPSLESLTMLYKIYHILISLIPRNYLRPVQCRTRHTHLDSFIQLFTTTSSHRLSFYPRTMHQWIKTVYPILFLLTLALWPPSKLQYASWGQCYFSLSQAWDKEKHLSPWREWVWPSTHWWDALTTELQPTGSLMAS